MLRDRAHLGWLGCACLAAVLAVAGCGDTGGTGEPTTESAAPAPTETESPTVSPSPSPKPSGTPRPMPPITPAPGEPPAQAAARDLAERLDLGTDAVRLVRVVEVTWPDASAGCPLPGMSYAQVLTDGTLIEFEVDGARYEYHSGGGRGLFLCRNPQPPARVHG